MVKTAKISQKSTKQLEVEQQHEDELNMAQILNYYRERASAHEPDR